MTRHDARMAKGNNEREGGKFRTKLPHLLTRCAQGTTVRVALLFTGPLDDRLLVVRLVMWSFSRFDVFPAEWFVAHLPLRKSMRLCNNSVFGEFEGGSRGFVTNVD